MVYQKIGFNVKKSGYMLLKVGILNKKSKRAVIISKWASPQEYENPETTKPILLLLQRFRCLPWTRSRQENTQRNRLKPAILPKETAFGDTAYSYPASGQRDLKS